MVHRRPSKKARATYDHALKEHQKSSGDRKKPAPLKTTLRNCKNCDGTGVISSTTFPEPKTDIYPRIAIIGGGIGGTALAVAFLHRGIPFTLYERDASFKDRSQGYGLTLQQASKAIQGLGIQNLKDGIVSTRHLVHNVQGDVLGSWGMRKWLDKTAVKPSKKTNIHIARQSLRWELLEQLHNTDTVKWGHEFEAYQFVNDKLQLKFKVNGTSITSTADLIVGADGIRSKVREQLIGSETSPLNYLGCIAILGICPYNKLLNLEHELLDSATVFQTANGTERMYMMPYNNTSVMWQFSYPIEEQNARVLSNKGAEALKQDTLKRVENWHAPIPQIISATDASLVSGYPLYDRDLLQPEWMNKDSGITLLGDAAHPMSPFKGQGANQALLDALSLARTITSSYSKHQPFKKTDLRNEVITSYELEMINRSSVKVKASAMAVEFLHSDKVLQKVDAPRSMF